MILLINAKPNICFVDFRLNVSRSQEKSNLSLLSLCAEQMTALENLHFKIKLFYLDPMFINIQSSSAHIYISITDIIHNVIVPEYRYCHGN